MKYKDFYSYLLNERYGGAAKERGIWYHGTSMKRVPFILSRGLDPNIPVKNKSWSSDPNASVNNIDKTSYGGIYVTQNLITATSAAWRTAKLDKANEAVVIMELQPRSLIGDEDDFADRLKDLSSNLAGSVYHAIYPYMWEVYGVPDYHKEYAEKYKVDWCDRAMNRIFYDMKYANETLKRIVYNMLYNEGYRVMLTRIVSYLKKSDFTDYWQWRKAYADIHGLKNYGEEVNIPDPVFSKEGEQEFRDFIDRLTRTVKNKARHTCNGASCDVMNFNKTARSLEPIKFHGRNKIISIVEIGKSRTEKYGDDVRIVYGQLPEDFIEQWRERKGDLRIVSKFV